jgi:hypothetical protein
MPSQPGLGGRPGPFRPAGEVDDLVVRRQPVEDGPALGEHRIIRDPGEERVPVARPGVEVAQPVTDIRQHTVEVDHRDRSVRLGSAGTWSVSIRGERHWEIADPRHS